MGSSTLLTYFPLKLQSDHNSIVVVQVTASICLPFFFPLSFFGTTLLSSKRISWEPEIQRGVLPVSSLLTFQVRLCATPKHSRAANPTHPHPSRAQKTHCTSYLPSTAEPEELQNYRRCSCLMPSSEQVLLSCFQKSGHDLCSDVQQA